MNLTTESFLGIILIMMGAIIATGYNSSNYIIYVSIAAILILKGLFLVVDDIAWKNRYAWRVLCLVLSR